MRRLLHARIRLLRQRPDDGYALPTVIGLTLIMLLMVTTALTSATGNLQRTATDLNIDAASAAAYAGVEEYMSRITNDSTYYKYGNPASTFSTSTSSVVSLPTGSAANPAFGVGTSGTWATVPGSTGSSFRYEIDNSDYAIDGIVRIRSTGRVGSSTQTVIADLRQTGFIDFLYFTDYETQDPDVITQTGGNDCIRHVWDSPGRDETKCTAITFGSQDTLIGPIHSNDRLIICGATFTGSVTTSYPGTPSYKTGTSGCGTKTYNVAYQPSINLPQTNSKMKLEARTDLPDDVPRPGCLYTGPTQITFLGGGKMKVISPWTKKTQVTAANTGTTPAQCGIPGTGSGQLGNASGATIPVLDQNLVFVQNVPGTASDPNYTSSLLTPTNFTCSGSGTSQGWSFGGVSYPVNNSTLGKEAIPATATSTPAYGCRNGDLYTQGTVGGAITAAAENYVYITGDITYDTAYQSILGLVGQNSVWVWNPYGNTSNTCTRNCATDTLLNDTDREIDAAILSVQHTFMVQNYNLGSVRGTLNIKGAIAQKFRGTVATTSNNVINHGYGKHYEYDSRLKHTAPPKFLTPVSTSYGVTQFASVGAAFSATGASQ